MAKDDKPAIPDPVGAPLPLQQVAPQVTGTVHDQYDIVLYACASLVKAIVESKLAAMYVVDPQTRRPVKSGPNKSINLDAHLDLVESEVKKLRQRMRDHEELVQLTTIV